MIYWINTISEPTGCHMPEKSQSNKTDLNACGACRSKGFPVCMGHAEGGGADEGDSHDNAAEGKHNSAFLPELQLLLSERLSPSRKLSLKYDEDLNTLTCTPQLRPELRPHEQQEELTKLLNNVIALLKKYPDQNIVSTKGLRIEKDSQGKIVSLSITSQSGSLYGSFIKNILNQNTSFKSIAPTPKFSGGKKKPEEEETLARSPSPFSIQLKPRGI